MKKFINNKTDVLNGVSTLDVMRKNLKTILLLSIITALSSAIYGGHSILDSVDPSFNPQIQTNSFSIKQVTVVMPLADGKILIAGNFNSYNRQPIGGVVRLNSDATIDTTFNSVSLAAGGYPTKIVVQPDGKLIIRGVDLRPSDQTAAGKQVIRLNSDGTFDTTFDYKLGGFVYDAAVDASGRTILSGVITDGNSVSRRVIRLNSDGSQDITFQFDIAFSTSVPRIAAQGDKVIISLESSSSSSVERLNENGTVDATFTGKILSSHQIASVTVQPDGKILVLNSANLYRLNENGGDDGGFTTINFPNYSPARQLSLSNDGKIVVSTGLSASEIRRYLSNGGVDDSFATHVLPEGYSCHGVQPDGGVIIGDASNSGVSTNIPNYFSRLHPDGTLDTSFNAGGIGFQSINPGSIRTIAVQTNEKILIGGKFDMVGNSVRYKIARLNADSSLDTTFQISTSGTNSFTQISDIYNITVQSDGKILVSGYFSYSINSVIKSNLVRLNADGSIDSTFNVDVLINDLFGCCAGGKNKTAVLGDGKIIVGTSRNLAPQLPFPLKLNADGSHDASFNPTIYAAQSTFFVYDLAVQPDGKIVIGGRYDNGGTQNAFLARLNSDGSSDQTFNISQESGRIVSALALLPNGKILFAKTSPFPSLIKRSDILSVNSDGSADDTFNAGTGANDRINTILASPSGKIFVGGRFNEFNGQKRQNLAQLKSDGSLVSTDYLVNAEVLSLAIDGEGRLLVGGDFTIISVGGGTNAKRTYIARLIDAEQSPRRTRFDFDGDGRADLGVFSGVAGIWRILDSQNEQTVSTYFGTSGDKTAAADFDGDGKTDIAVWRPSEGIWYLLQSNAGFSAIHWGAAEDKPVAADFDGDGKADIAVWRPSNGTWYILQSSNNQFVAYQFGLSDDIPLTDADLDGDGKADIAVWRPSNGVFYWLASGSGNQFKAVQFGQTGDIPAVGDFNGDGKTDLVVFRPSNGVWYQYLTQTTEGYALSAFRFGQAGDQPVAADYDGDGKTDFAVRRQNIWYIQKSLQGFTGAYFADSTDTALAALPN
ncbi:MAG: FG-GAP-like repeat-containing protein [Acidobacteriota bacterium]